MTETVTAPKAARERAIGILLDIVQRRAGDAVGRVMQATEHQVAEDYAAGHIDEIDDEMRRALPRISARTLGRWRRADAPRVIGRPPAVFDDARDLILSMIHHYPHINPKAVHRALKARLAPPVPSLRAVQRWMMEWKRDNAQLYEYLRDPDSWRSRFQAASGNAAWGIAARNALWEVDSTLGDLMLADGKRHTVIALIEVYSRAAMVLITPTSRSTAVAALLRRALMEWGVPAIIRTDGGAEYVSRHLERVARDLQIYLDECPPFTPEAKPFVERFIGAWSHGLAPLLAGYVGHSVAAREAIRARASFAQRMASRGRVEPLEIGITPEKLQALSDGWIENIYMHEPHGGLEAGRTPFEQMAACTMPVKRITDERALDVLLMAPPRRRETGRITKKGVKLDRRWYTAPELGGREGEDVRIRVDPTDAGRIWLFAEDGVFVAVAENPELTGTDPAELAAKRKAVQRQVMREGKAALAAIAKRVDVTNIAEEIIDHARGQHTPLEMFPAPVTEHMTEAIEQALIAADAGEEASASRAATPATATPAAPPPPAPEAAPNMPLQRFRRWLGLREAAEVSDFDDAWRRRYETTPEWRGLHRIYEEFGASALTG